MRICPIILKVTYMGKKPDNKKSAENLDLRGLGLDDCREAYDKHTQWANSPEGKAFYEDNSGIRRAKARARARARKAAEHPDSENKD